MWNLCSLQARRVSIDDDMVESLEEGEDEEGEDGEGEEGDSGLGSEDSGQTIESGQGWPQLQDCTHEEFLLPPMEPSARSAFKCIESYFFLFL